MTKTKRKKKDKATNVLPDGITAGWKAIEPQVSTCCDTHLMFDKSLYMRGVAALLVGLNEASNIDKAQEFLAREFADLEAFFREREQFDAEAAFDDMADAVTGAKATPHRH